VRLQRGHPALILRELEEFLIGEEMLADSKHQRCVLRGIHEAWGDVLDCHFLSLGRNRFNGTTTRHLSRSANLPFLGGVQSLRASKSPPSTRLQVQARGELPAKPRSIPEGWCPNPRSPVHHPRQLGPRRGSNHSDRIRS